MLPWIEKPWRRSIQAQPTGSGLLGHNLAESTVTRYMARQRRRMPPGQEPPCVPGSRRLLPNCRSRPEARLPIIINDAVKAPSAGNLGPHNMQDIYSIFATAVEVAVYALGAVAMIYAVSAIV